ncbi:hypothetical protein [Fodinicola feengrottensis]|uniref:hypothetical protein n=1 Tax=Fodinicola feengrottensis TaxID=435914 RepID=UPI0031E1F949
MKTKVTMWNDANFSNIRPSPVTLCNVIFDAVAYDYAFDGSQMAYGSSLMCNIPGVYRLRAAHFWDVTNIFPGNATPFVGTRNVAYGINHSGQFLSDRQSGPPTDVQFPGWDQDAPLTTSGTAIVQPVRARAVFVRLIQGDQIELFAGQDSGNRLLDYVVNQNSSAAATLASGFTTFLAAEWVRS